MKQYQLSVRPRHLRYMFFIDEKTSYEELYSIIISNQKQWGGWYNPIVPVTEGEIKESWVNLIKNYDPDYIFYSKDIDPEMILRLKLFNPISYIKLDEKRGFESSGVNAFYFISKFPTTSNLVMLTGGWKTKSPLLSYYLLNYGIESDFYHHQIELSKDYNVKQLTSDDFDTFNKCIYDLRPINPSQLSRENLNTKIFFWIKEVF